MAEKRNAWVIVDLVNDFVTGKFGSEYALNACSGTAETLKKISGKTEIIFTLDTHIEDDPEFRVWGEHCLIGTEGCKLHPLVSQMPGYRITKRHFDAFYDTDLDGYLRARKVNSLYISGVSTDICVLHTAAGAFFRGYVPVIIDDLCAAIDPEKHSDALAFMKRNYGVRIIDSRTFLEELK